MSDVLTPKQKHLSMRAKKMTAHIPEVPSPQTLRELFARKGTEVSTADSQMLVREIREHRRTKGIGGRSPEKPKQKEEVRSRSKPSRKYSMSYGR